MKERTFGLYHKVPGRGMPKAWRAIVTRQATALAGMLRRFERVVTQSSTDRARHAAKLHECVAEALQLLEEQAREHIVLERDLAALEAEYKDVLALPSEAARNFQALKRVNEILHANLMIARRFLETTIQETV